MRIHPFSWLSRLVIWFTHIGRDSIIYPTAQRIHMFALGNVLGLAALIAYHYWLGSATSILVVEAIAIVLALALWVLCRRNPEGRFPHLGFYSIVIWYCFAMANSWAYVADEYSRLRLIILLVTVSTYYLMAEWWHIVLGTLITVLGCYALAVFLKWPVAYPPQGHWVLLGTTHVCWLGFSLSNRSKREARLRDTQALVRHLQRGLQPGLQSIEALMPELRYALSQASVQSATPAPASVPTSAPASASASAPVEARQLKAEDEAPAVTQALHPSALAPHTLPPALPVLPALNGPFRIWGIARRLQNNTIAMEDYLDLQCINARYMALEGRLEVLHAQQLLHHVIENYPYTSESYKSAVRLEVEQDFAFVGVHLQWVYTLRNLLHNALTAVYCKRVRPQPGDVRVKLQVQNGQGYIRFIDKGIGISAHDLPYVFEPFYSAGKFAGLGLGLSYCQAVVEGVGGQIALLPASQIADGQGEAKNLASGGCVLQLTLPRVEVQP